MARTSDPATLTLVVCWTSGLALIYGAMRVDDPMLRNMEAADRYARETSNDYGLAGAQLVLGVTLLRREAAAGRDCGLEPAAIGPLHEHAAPQLPVAEVFAVHERARCDDEAFRDVVPAISRWRNRWLRSVVWAQAMVDDMA
ncbi:hypothetical protein [Gordonia aquimaris]|uniref:Uncharacterized protein n=1 Tax=Gordonia aquimaris TaxID=2984863 RepID=A0A9X3I554_9ACTN|nr:hypothetical protein [Gordonia aquimaris]MCX2965397.1 hypothetical protein [Gordonia aquimaris]